MRRVRAVHRRRQSGEPAQRSAGRVQALVLAVGHAQADRARRGGRWRLHADAGAGLQRAAGRDVRGPAPAVRCSRALRAVHARRPAGALATRRRRRHQRGSGRARAGALRSRGQLSFHERAGRRRAVRAARLLGAGDPGRRPVRRRPPGAAGPRHRSGQPLGGRPAPGAVAIGRRHHRRRHAGAQRRLRRRDARRDARPGARPGLQGAGADAAVGGLRVRAAHGAGRSATRARRLPGDAGRARRTPVRRLGGRVGRPSGHRRLQPRRQAERTPSTGQPGARDARPQRGPHR